MLSAAYQQSSVAPGRTAKLDPDNRLFGRMNRLRLEAEPLRDSLLAAAGRLDTTVGGPAVRDFNAPRRTVYIMTVRSDRSGFGPLFDMADSTNSVPERTVSTVAPQALFMLNNVFVLEQAAALAKRLLSEAAGGDEARIGRAYELLYARPPKPEELRIGLGFLARARHAYSRPPFAVAVSEGPPSARPSQRDLAAWKQYCQVLLCANEFIYVD